MGKRALFSCESFFNTARYTRGDQQQEAEELFHEKGLQQVDNINTGGGRGYACVYMYSNERQRREEREITKLLYVPGLFC
jgi:hypothetical protein